MAKIPAYSGSGRFAFVSYSHKDSDKVYPIIEMLINMGYNIWYDEGIPLVVDYGGVLYRKIKECSAFLLFVSEHSVKSEDVDKEVRNALSLKKPVVRVNIDSSQIPDAWAYHIPSTVNWISITAEPSEFYGKVCAALTECRQSQRKREAEKQEDVLREEAVPAETKSENKTIRRSDAIFSGRIRAIITVASVCALLMFGWAGSALYDTIHSPDEADAGDSVVSHSSEPSEDYEVETNLVVQGDSDNISDDADEANGSIAESEAIPDEVVIGGKTVKTSAKTVDLSGTGVSDISSLKYFINLEELDISYGLDEDGSYNPQNRNRLSDLTPLADCRKLEKLVLWGNSISDIYPLAGLTKLTHLDLDNNNITDITPLTGLTELTKLELWNNNITDITPLAGLTKLKGLNLGHNNITDIEPLKNLTKLTWLVLDSADFTAAQKAELEAALPNCEINWW